MWPLLGAHIQGGQQQQRELQHIQKPISIYHKLFIYDSEGDGDDDDDSDDNGNDVFDGDAEDDGDGDDVNRDKYVLILAYYVIYAEQTCSIDVHIRPKERGTNKSYVTACKIIVQPGLRRYQSACVVIA